MDIRRGLLEGETCRSGNNLESAKADGTPRLEPDIEIIIGIFTGAAIARLLLRVSPAGRLAHIGKKNPIAMTDVMPTMMFIGIPIFRKSLKR